MAGLSSCHFSLGLNIFVALVQKDFENVIIPKELKFNDEYYTLKGRNLHLSNSKNFTAYNALKDVNDVKTNNYSNIFLTKKLKNSDILTTKEIAKPRYRDFITTISFLSADNSDSSQQGVWLTITKGFDTYETDTTTISFSLTEGDVSSSVATLFRIECIDEIKCNISHNFGDGRYYLIYDNGFKMTLQCPETTGYYTYILEEDKMKLFKVIDNVLYQVVCKKTKDGWVLDLENNLVDDEYSIIYINSQEEEINRFINTSWIVYDRSNSISAINKEKSAFDLENQFIIHHEYSNEDNMVNMFPLKNNLTYQGTVTNGSNLYLSNNGKMIEDVKVDYRNYTNINSGINQELGSETITLTFNFSDQVFHLNEGDECVFSLPTYDFENGEMSPIYPYETLNINDSAFVRNGAFASNTPYFADKFKKYQNHNTDFNNGTYLCSWLYQEDENSVPVWMDRYYYPDFTSKAEAVSGEHEDILIDGYFKASESGYNLNQIASLKNELKKRSYFDKKSDLTIEPGTSYKFSRISKEMVQEVYDNNADSRIEYVRDQHYNTVSLSQEFAFNGENWRMLESNSFNKSKGINFNTNLYINPHKKMGLQLFGCDYKFGFNIQNRKDLTPFTYYATEETVYMMNNQMVAVNQFNILEKYNERVSYLLVSAPFDDVYLFTETSLFIFDYDLRLKNRILLSDIFRNGNISDESYQDISSKHAIYYNGNIYAIVNSNNDILKIIFNPENNADEKAIKQKSISCRILSKGEYITNFGSVEYNENLVQTEHKLKSIFAKDGKLYGFNYDIVKMSHDGDTIYGIVRQSSEVNPPWYYIFNQSLSKLYISESSSKYAEFSSEVSIDSIAYGPDGMFALIRDFDSKTGVKALEIYDKSKTKIYNYPLEGYDDLISLDYYRYIDEAHEEQDAFVVMLKMGDYSFAVEYQINNERIVSKYTSLDSKVVPTFRNIIDSNLFINNLDENKLYFNLYLIDQKLPITHIWDLKDAQEGWYNINVEVDIDNAKFIIKINDKVHGLYNSETNLNFKKYARTLNSIFDGTYYFGIMGKKHGTTLGEIINQGLKYDPYSIKNTKTENTVIYNRPLSYYEYQAMRLKFSKINPLVLTLPCGVRNGIEEIIRYFKFAKPASISNSVKINISGIDNKIFLERDLEQLKTYILDSLSNTDYLTTIKEIEFI